MRRDWRPPIAHGMIHATSVGHPPKGRAEIPDFSAWLATVENVD